MVSPLSYQSMKLVPGPSSDILLPPSPRRLGTPDRAQPGPGSIRIDEELEILIGDRPMVYRLADLYREGHQNVPPDPNTFPIYDRAEFWVIIHALGVMKRRGAADLACVGYIADFGHKITVGTVGMAPESSYVENLRMQTALGVEGNFELPNTVTDLLEAVKTLAPGIELKLTANVKFVGKLDFAVRTRVISAVGIGRSSCEWLFRRGREDLFGNHLMVQLIRVPPDTSSVSCTAKAYAQIKNWWDWTLAPRLTWTEEVQLTCTPS
jgi:hypothetical protein